MSVVWLIVTIGLTSLIMRAYVLESTMVIYSYILQNDLNIKCECECAL